MQSWLWSEILVSTYAIPQHNWDTISWRKQYSKSLLLHYYNCAQLSCTYIMSTKFITCVNPNMTFLLQSANTKLSLHTSIHTHICFTALWTLYGITWLSQYKKGKTNVDFTEARNSKRQWHQLAICKSVPRFRQITMLAPQHSVFYRPDAVPAAKPTASKHWR